MKINPYSSEIETVMRDFYQSLSEKDRRRYAAIEAKELGYGGVSYICRVLQCNDSTAVCGLAELDTLLPQAEKRVHLFGDERKKTIAQQPDLDDAFLRVLKNHTAGSPMDETIRWTNLEIATHLQSNGFTVSVTAVDKLLEKHNFRRRQAFKAEAGQQVEQRDEQFQNIAALKEQYHARGNPVMSMDVKKRDDRQLLPPWQTLYSGTPSGS